MRVIAVGHTPEKMQRLYEMVLPQANKFCWELTTVFNGEGWSDPRPKGRRLRTANDPKGRDVAMYAHGLEDCYNEHALFVNDDVQALNCAPFRRLAKHEQVVGVAGLNSWIDYELIDDPAVLEFYKQRGRDAYFIRTSAFYMTRRRFWHIWTQCNGSAQAFEKGTLTGLLPHEYRFIHPQYAVDSNIAPYVLGEEDEDD